MDDPEQWRWIWLVAAVLFGIGEMATPGAFFLAPFAVGALVASILAFAGVDLPWEWAAFVGVSLASFLALRPFAGRLDKAETAGVGSRRLVGRTGVVLEAIEPGRTGLVRVEHEEWRATSEAGAVIAADRLVTVLDVEGTRVIVREQSEAAS